MELSERADISLPIFFGGGRLPHDISFVSLFDGTLALVGIVFFLACMHVRASTYTFLDSDNKQADGLDWAGTGLGFRRGCWTGLLKLAERD